MLELLNLFCFFCNIALSSQIINDICNGNNINKWDIYYDIIKTSNNMYTYNINGKHNCNEIINDINYSFINFELYTNNNTQWLSIIDNNTECINTQFISTEIMELTDTLDICFIAYSINNTQLSVSKILLQCMSI